MNHMMSLRGTSLRLLLLFSALVVVLWFHDPLISSSSSSSSSLPAFGLEKQDSAGSNNPPIHHRSKDNEYDNNNDKLEPVYQLINRVLHYNHSRRDFQLAILSSKGNSDTIPPCRLPCFTIQDQSSIQQQQQQQQHHRISIQGGPTVSELTAGIGWYLRHVAHISGLDIWPSYLTNTVPRAAIFSPNWPIPVGDGVVLTHHRQVPYSHLMNVCTHSYSLVWYSADDWIRFIDWMALSGINMMLALTGQEWIQYQVFRTMGLSDRTIREWFNGPAFLTWSRGQNEYGSNIGGPLPISWMKDQWNLQRDVILPLIRQLDIIGQLPAFQGNVPIQLKDIYHDANITQQGGTGWMDSLDPLFGQVANRWMETLIRDFGTDHWYQLDGYFNGGTAPWFQQTGNDISMITPSPPNDHHDELWYQRGVHAYQGLNQTDPDAIWSFQGFAIVGWETPEQASYFKGFVDSVPSKDKFVVMDMSYDPQQPEWAKWNRSAFFGASFVWNVLHNFGGTDGIKGDMQKVNRMPFDALNISGQARPIGLGATPEGITQNPAYYQFLYEQAFQQGPVPNLTSHLILQMHQRYGVDPKYHFDPDIVLSWKLLLESLYSTDRSVQDGTGVGHWTRERRSSLFLPDRYTPSDLLCQVVDAWDHLLRAAQRSRRQGLAIHESPSFQYDLVNLGREVLAQLSTPMALNFSDAVLAATLDPVTITLVGNIYQELLLDLDTLVDTEDSFRLERWLKSARKLGKNASDCELPPTAMTEDGAPLQSPNGTTLCEVFYEWNARCQVTTWNPTLANARQVPGGPIDYAAKHWSGLIREYYVKRISLVQAQALDDATMKQPMNETRVDEILALHAYRWTLLESFHDRLDGYRQHHDTVQDEGDYIDVSQKMFRKYKPWFIGPGCMGDRMTAWQ